MATEGGSMMRILLAIDGSPAADRARDLVAALPWREDGRVRIVSVAPTRPELQGVPWSLAATADDDQIEDEVLRIHRDALDAAEREISCARSDVAIESVLVRGRPGTVIVGSGARDGRRPHRRRPQRDGPLGVDAPRVRVGRGGRSRAVPRPRGARRPARADRAGRRWLVPRPHGRVRRPAVAALQRACR